MKILTIYLFLLFLIEQSTTYALSTWTQTYTKSFNLEESSTTKKTLYFTNKDKKQIFFSQLIFSWNAIRPQHGYFRFSARVHNAHTKKWGAWHRMAEWGSNIQRSFESSSCEGTKFHYVRLEVDKNQVADLFEIRVEAFGGASLNQFKFAAVTTSQFNNFMPEYANRHHKRVASIMIQGVPKLSQVPFEKRGERILCSPTSMSMVTQYMCKKKINIKSFARHTFDHGLKVYGSWPFNTAHAFEACDHKVYFYVTRLHSFNELYALLTQKIPVVVSVRGWMHGAPKAYRSGHLLVVVGYDARRREVLVHDPAQRIGKTLTHYKLGQFLTAWERSYRLAYVAQPITKDVTTCST